VKEEVASQSENGQREKTAHHVIEIPWQYIDPSGIGIYPMYASDGKSSLTCKISSISLRETVCP